MTVVMAGLAVLTMTEVKLVIEDTGKVTAILADILFIKSIIINA